MLLFCLNSLSLSLLQPATANTEQTITMVSFKAAIVSLLAPSLALAFVHPGYVISTSQLDFVKAKVAANAEPWTSAYNRMLQDSDKYGKYASGTRTSTPTATVSCGPTTTPDIKCTDERGDALAAWANALAWYISGNTAYAKNAIGLMNKWSYVIKGRPFPLSLVACLGSSFS